VVVFDYDEDLEVEKLQLWAREPTEDIWTLLSSADTSSWGSPFSVNFSSGHIQAAVDYDGSVLIAAFDRSHGRYEWVQLGWSDPDFTWSCHPEWGFGFPVESMEGHVLYPPMMCSGPINDPSNPGVPRLLGRFNDGFGYGFYSAVGSAGGLLVLSASPVPDERRYFSMALDQSRDTVVVYGGHVNGDENTFFSDVWESSEFAEGFSRVHAGPGPGPVGNTGRSGAAMCYHRNLGGMLVYGGRGLGYTNPGTSYYGRGAWLWNGSRWRRALGTETDYNDPVSGGAANNHFFRTKARMAYDPKRDTPVIFRGQQV
jgi:hypothetical protein